MKKAILKLEYVPGDCMSCIISCYKKYDNGEQGLYCAGVSTRMKLVPSEIHKDCPLLIIEE